MHNCIIREAREDFPRGSYSTCRNTTATWSQAMIMLSGYECELYDRYLSSWRKVQVAARAQSTGIRTETLWMNYWPAEQTKEV